jgi:hypothetical protein
MPGEEMVFMVEDRMKAILYNPLLNFFFFSFFLNAAWEWIQSPFFVDITTDLNTIIWYRIHCTLGDSLVLMAGYILMSLYHRNLNWVYFSNVKHHAIFVLMGFAYTFLSEYVNVHIKGSWSYSEYMPLLPFTNIGLVPLVQWIILPPVIIFITKRQVRA